MVYLKKIFNLGLTVSINFINKKIFIGKIYKSKRSAVVLEKRIIIDKINTIIE